MTLTDIAKLDGRALTPRERINIWEEFFRKNPQALEKRRQAFKGSFGGVDESDGQAMENAIWSGRRDSIEPPETLESPSK